MEKVVQGSEALLKHLNPGAGRILDRLAVQLGMTQSGYHLSILSVGYVRNSHVNAKHGARGPRPFLRTLDRALTIEDWELIGGLLEVPLRYQNLLDFIRKRNGQRFTGKDLVDLGLAKKGGTIVGQLNAYLFREGLLFSVQKLPKGQQQAGHKNFEDYFFQIYPLR